MQSSIFEVSLFGISIAPKWYGLMYALGFIICHQFLKKWGNLRQKELDSLLFFVFFGVIGGGRVGYVLFYNFEHFFHNPYDILKIWEGGMSFHGGLIGVLIAIILFARKEKKSFFSLTDSLAIIIPIALGLGRIGNWINGELLGFSPYNGPFRMVVGSVGYFPSPLFEMLLEGGVLFLIMIGFSKRVGYFNVGKHTMAPAGYLSALFLIGYSVMRLIAEQFRLPDAHIGYLLGTEWITLGMIYTLPMLIGGIFLLVWKGKHETTPHS